MIAFPAEFYWIAAVAIVAAVVNSAGILAIFQHREWAERSLPIRSSLVAVKAELTSFNLLT